LRYLQDLCDNGILVTSVLHENFVVSSAEGSEICCQQTTILGNSTVPLTYLSRFYKLICWNVHFEPSEALHD